MNYDEQKLKVNDALHRLELEIEGSIAFIEYKLLREKLLLIHTEVPPALRGRAQSATVQKGFQQVKDNNYKMVPICPFVGSYLKRHKEWNDIVTLDAEGFIHKLLKGVCSIL